MKAKFPGRCAACGHSILEGEEIVGGTGSWVHERCADEDEVPHSPYQSAYRPKVKATVCSTCYMTSCDCDKE